MYAVAILIHATAGTVGFFLGLLLALRPGLAARAPSAVRIYVTLMLILVVGLVAAVAVGWSEMANVQRFVDVGLIVLGFYTLYRASRAALVLKQASNNWEPAFINHIGFTLISLFDGFIIVAAINLGAPTPLVLLIAALGVGGGIATITRLQTRATLHERA